MIYQTHCAEETHALGRALGELLLPGDIVLLQGDLGVGKSVLTRGLADGCDIHEAMPSPTFTLMAAYKGRIPFYHFDLYRLDDADAYYEAGLDEFVGGDGAAVIEWPSCAELAFDECLELTIERMDEDENARRLTLTAHGLGARSEAFEQAAEKWRVRS